MQSKRLVIDANILIRAVLGVRVRALIEQYSEGVAFHVAEFNYLEAVAYLAELAPARGISDEVWRAALVTVMAAIQIVPQEELAAVEAQSRAGIARRDENDWPAVAAALQFDCAVWTEDADFFGAGIATWTTETVELFLAA